MIVVDLGCKTYGEDASLIPLIDRFAPRVLYGFDPLLEYDATTTIDGTDVELRKKAAWLHDGTILLGVGAPFHLDATVLADKNDRDEWSVTTEVPCFDFSKWLSRLPETVVLKLNVEGAEFPLLERLIADGTVEQVEHLIVSWHDGRLKRDYPSRREYIEAAFGLLHIPVEEWKLVCSTSQ